MMGRNLGDIGGISPGCSLKRQDSVLSIVAIIVKHQDIVVSTV